MASVNRLSTGLWFDDQAEEAAQFYTAIIRKRSTISGGDSLMGEIWQLSNVDG